MRHLHLIIQTPREHLPDTGTEPPGLAKLLRRGQGESAPAGFAESCCQALGVARQQDWPVSPLTAKAAGMAVNGSYWLRLDPVHLDVGMNGMFLHRVEPLGPLDAATLGTVVAPIFAQAAVETHVGADGVLYVRCNAVPRLATTPLDQVDGRQPTRFLPTGEDAPGWIRLLHEVQMALHDHPWNQSRALSGKPPVNSLWPWGGGVLPHQTGKLGGIWAECALCRQVAQALDTPFHTPAGGLDDFLKARGDRGLVVLSVDRGAPPALPGDWEKKWFKPMLGALRMGRLASVRLILLDGEPQARHITPLGAWRFWR